MYVCVFVCVCVSVCVCELVGREDSKFEKKIPTYVDYVEGELEDDCGR